MSLCGTRPSLGTVLQDAQRCDAEQLMQLEMSAWQIFIVDVALLAQCTVAVVREG
jgi:hypothetical protein